METEIKILCCYYAGNSLATYFFENRKKGKFLFCDFVKFKIMLHDLVTRPSLVSPQIIHSLTEHVFKRVCSNWPKFESDGNVSLLDSGSLRWLDWILSDATCQAYTFHT